MHLTFYKFKKRLVILTGFFILAFPAVALAQLAVEFETGAPPATLFAESNFLPGDDVVRWARLTNETESVLPVGLQVANFSDPDGLAGQIDLIISENGGQLFSGTLAELSAIGEFTLDNALPGNTTKQFDFSATFNPDSPGDFALAEVSFDLIFGIITAEPENQGPTIQSSVVLGGGGGRGLAVTSGGGNGGISGALFNDANSNGIFDPSEWGLSDWIVYLDLNNNNLLDSGEIQTLTGAGGAYTFSALADGTYTVRTILQAGWSFVVPSEAAEFEYAVGVLGGTAANINFGVVQGQVAGISDTVSYDDYGNPTDSQGQVLAETDVLPKTGMDPKILLLFLVLCGVSVLGYSAALRVSVNVSR